MLSSHGAECSGFTKIAVFLDSATQMDRVVVSGVTLDGTFFRGAPSVGLMFFRQCYLKAHTELFS